MQLCLPLLLSSPIVERNLRAGRTSGEEKSGSNVSGVSFSVIPVPRLSARGAVLTAACRGRAESPGIKGPLSKGLLAGLKAAGLLEHGGPLGNRNVVPPQASCSCQSELGRGAGQQGRGAGRGCCWNLPGLVPGRMPAAALPRSPGGRGPGSVLHSVLRGPLARLPQDISSPHPP